MSTLIFNVNIVMGDGKTILENRSLAINGELIEGIIRVPYPSYDKSDLVIDGRGGFVIPGIIDHHSHGITTGPTSCGNAALPVPKLKVVKNLNRHLLEGTTTILNQDGFATLEEVTEARGLTSMLVQTMSTHLPLHIEYAKLLNLGGLREQHCLPTAEGMIKQGAIGIGEVGGTADPAYYDLFHFPTAVKEKTGILISQEESRALRIALFAQPPDEKAASDLMAKIGVSAAMRSLKELVEQSGPLMKLARESCQEAAMEASKLGVPLIMHNTPTIKSVVLDCAKVLKGLLVAAHSNLDYKPLEAMEVAKAVRKEGGWVDVQIGDFFGCREFFRNHATTLALLEEGLVDMISTDYVRGYWDPILRVLEYAVLQNVIDLPQAIALATGNVLKAIPNIAPNRGQIAEGKIADLAILSQKSISEVRTVLIGGKVVVDEGRIVTSLEVMSE